MRLIHALTLLTALLFATLLWQARPLSPSIPQLQLTFTPEAFMALLNQWSSADVARFHDHFFFDFLFLAAYGLWGWVLVQQSEWVQPSGTSAARLWAWCTPAASCMDALENILHLHLVFTPGPFQASEYLLAGSVATAKWVLLLVFGIKLLAVFFARLGSTHR
jgi:hypothetical protein